jgi:phosphotransferase system IIB component
MKNIHLAHYLTHINSSKIDTQEYKNCITPIQIKYSNNLKSRESELISLDLHKILETAQQFNVMVNPVSW